MSNARIMDIIKNTHCLFTWNIAIDCQSLPLRIFITNVLIIERFQCSHSFITRFLCLKRSFVIFTFSRVVRYPRASGMLAQRIRDMFIPFLKLISVFIPYYALFGLGLGISRLSSYYSLNLFQRSNEPVGNHLIPMCKENHSTFCQ